MSSGAAYPCVHNNPSQLVNSPLIWDAQGWFLYNIMNKQATINVYIYCKLQVMACTWTWTLVEPLILYSFMKKTIVYNTKSFYCVAGTLLTYGEVFPHECIVLQVVKTTSLSFPWWLSYCTYGVFHTSTNKHYFRFPFLNWIADHTLKWPLLLLAIQAKDLVHALNISPVNRLEWKWW